MDQGGLADLPRPDHGNQESTGLAEAAGQEGGLGPLEDHSELLRTLSNFTQYPE
jgi:hypothetical protein